MEIIYRTGRGTPLRNSEIRNEESFVGSPRFDCIILPIAGDGTLDTNDEKIIYGCGRSWHKAVENFAEAHARDIAKAKGKFVDMYLYIQSACLSLEILGMPVMPLKTGVLQYDWVDAGLRSVAGRFRDHPVKLAMANIMRPNLDDGIEWSVIDGIIRKALARTSIKLYVYPPEGVDVPEHGAEPEAVGGATA